MIEEDLLWSVGHHPFGALSEQAAASSGGGANGGASSVSVGGGVGVSALLRDTAHRNAVFSRVDSALGCVRR